MKKFSVLAAILVVATVVLSTIGCANESSGANGPGVVSSWKKPDTNSSADGVTVTQTTEIIFYNDNTFKKVSALKIDGDISKLGDETKAGLEVFQKMYPVEGTGTYTGNAGADGEIKTKTTKVTIKGKDFKEYLKEIGQEARIEEFESALTETTYTIAGNELKLGGNVVAKKQ